MPELIRKHILLFLICLLTAFNGSAQDLIRFQNLTVEDGLSMGTITGIQMDNRGFIWLATAEGLHRYDGENFRIFKHIDGVRNSLSDSYIRTMISYGDYLVTGSNSGTIDVMSTTDYQFSTYRPADISPGFDYPIHCLTAFEGMIVIGTEGGGLWSLDIGRKELRPYPAKGSDTLGLITAIEEHGGILYVCAGNKIFRIDDGKMRLLYAHSTAITCLKFHNGRFLIGTPERLFTTDIDFSVVIAEKLPERKRRINVITNILSENDNIAWIATEGGLLRMTKEGFTHYEHEPLRPFSLVNNQINTLFLDKNDILWIGTIAGLSRYASTLKKFGLIQYFDFNGQNYNNNIYYVYTKDSGSVWLGTLTGGLIELSPDHRIKAVYPVIRDGAAETRAVRCIFRDSKGNFWIGTRDEGLFIMNEGNGTFRSITGNGDQKLGSKVVRAIYEDGKGRLWIGTQNGLFQYHYETGNFTQYKAEPGSMVNNTINQITTYPGTQKLIIASFRGGLQIFNPETGQFVTYKHHPDDSTSLSNNNVMSLEWLNKDTLLIGTYGGGLNIWDLKSKRFAHVTEKNGLINNAVYGILHEGAGKVWLSTNNGIVLLDLRSMHFTNFKPVHYLQSTEYNEGAFAKSATGYFYFGGVNGLNFFRPDRIYYDTSAPALYITDIRGNYETEENGHIDLSFLSSRLEIDFMALYYVNPEGVHYKYRMQGYDQDWVEPGQNNTAIYPRLSPGSYTFEVMAEDEFGKWTSVPIVLQVFVAPPFWQEWWFISLMTLLVLGLIYAVFRYRTAEIERTYKHQLVDSELRALRSQMNPHFIFNSLNSIQYFILKKQPQEAYTYLSKFASLMRKILQNSRLKYISVADEIEWLELYLEMEKLRMDNNLDYTFDTGNIQDPDNTFIPTMLIQPYVENSIIHGLLSKEHDRRISIAFSLHGKHVECVVEDNGIGREASRIMNEKRTRKHQSAGMDLTRKRLEILSEGKGEFDVQIEDLDVDGQASGTRVRIVIPLIENVE